MSQADDFNCCFKLTSCVGTKRLKTKYRATKTNCEPNNQEITFQPDQYTMKLATIKARGPSTVKPLTKNGRGKSGALRRNAPTVTGASA